LIEHATLGHWYKEQTHAACLISLDLAGLLDLRALIGQPGVRSAGPDKAEAKR